MVARGRPGSDDSENHPSPQQSSEGKINIGERASKQDFVDITALIRSIQRVEGNFDCFGKAQGYCDQAHCAWRVYCLGDNHACPG